MSRVGKQPISIPDNAGTGASTIKSKHRRSGYVDGHLVGSVIE